MIEVYTVTVYHASITSFTVEKVSQNFLGETYARYVAKKCAKCDNVMVVNVVNDFTSEVIWAYDISKNGVFINANCKEESV